MYLTTFIFFIRLSCSKSQTVGLDFGHLQGNYASFHVTMTFSTDWLKGRIVGSFIHGCHARYLRYSCLHLFFSD